MLHPRLAAVHPIKILMKSVVWKCALWLCVFVWPLGVAAATPLATATIVDGEVLLIRGATRLQLTEGVRLGATSLTVCAEMQKSPGPFRPRSSVIPAG